jgi:hypothetical protein
MEARDGRKKLYIHTFVYFILLVSVLYILGVPAARANASSTVVLINEVMYDPEGSDGGYEWIEIKNISGYYINLVNWRIQAAGTHFTDVITLEKFKMAPNEIRVIGGPNTSADYVVSSLSFQNGGSETDGVRILNDEGFLSDTVLYDSPNTNKLKDDIGELATTFAPDVSSGHSLCRITAVDTDNSEIDFIECSSPTPGLENEFPPIAKVEYDNPIYIGEEFVLDGSSSSDIDGIIEKYSWKIDNELIADSTPIINWIFNTIDVHSIELTVTDNTNLATSTSLEIEVIEDPQNPQLTEIVNARTLDEKEYVSVKGVVTAAPGVLYEKEGYIQDLSGGIRFKVSESEITQGNTYILSGKIDTVYGEKRLVVKKIIQTKDNITVGPLIIKNYNDLVKNIGKIVTVSGIISKKIGNYIYVDNQGITAKINISKYIDFEVPSDIKDKPILVTGIISQYGRDESGNPKIRIMPTSPNDISIDGDVLAVTGTPTYFLLFILPIAFFYITKHHNICFS